MSVEETDFQFLAENSRDLILRIGMDLKYYYVSPASLSLLGWHPEEMIGKHVSSFVYREDLPLVTAVVERALTQGINSDSITVRGMRKDGSLVWVETSTRVIRDEITGEAREFVIGLRDVSERKALEEKLAALAMTDGLTGLANRRAFDEALNREWKRTLRKSAAISLVLLDVDHFKLFNDSYGHQVGDDCLRTVAATLRATVRESDVPARYGGEELAVILPDTHSAAAAELAERFRSEVEALGLTHGGNPDGGGFVTVSIGVATALSRDGGTIAMPEGLLLSADLALYKAKHEGRNRVATTLLVAPIDR
jgi:diguanylate cyclase (GGDEF)-like protein/PAS domain S-box-containing protein